MNIAKTNLVDLLHQTALMEMVEAFSADTFGVNQPLPKLVREQLIDGLRAPPRASHSGLDSLPSVPLY